MQARDMGSIPGSGRFPREGNGNSLQYSSLKNPMDKGAWWVIVHGVAELDTTDQACKLMHWSFWTVAFKKTAERIPQTERRSNQSVLKGNQSWVFIGRTDFEAETPILWPPDEKNWLTNKDPDAGKDWRQEEKGATEDKMVGWHHGPDGHEFEQAPGVGYGQGGLVYCSPWGH